MRGSDRGALSLAAADLAAETGLPFTKPLPILNHTNTLSALTSGPAPRKTGDLLISLNGRDYVSYLVDAPGERSCAYLLRFDAEGFHSTAAPRGTGEYLRWGAETFSAGTSRGKSFPCEGEASGEHAGGGVLFCPFREPASAGPALRSQASFLGLTPRHFGHGYPAGIVEGAALDLFHAASKRAETPPSAFFLCSENPAGGDLAAVVATS